MSHHTIKLTPRQLKLVWQILDGAADAGACEDGLTAMEQRTIEQISNKLLPHILAINKAKRPLPATPTEGRGGGK